jgi:hypothetical protein
MTTATERAQDLEHALYVLNNCGEHFRNGGLLLVSAEYGTGETDYFRVSTVTDYTNHRDETSQGVSHLTWAVAIAFRYRLRDKNGRWHLAISGGGYSKPDEIARDLAEYYGLERLRYEII